jgi:ribonuclease Z
MTTIPRPEVRLPELLARNHPFRQWKTWTIPGTRLTLTGYSRANDKTFFHIPELRCCIDAGLCEGRQPDTVFLTHTHNDHVADIEFLAGKSTGVEIYVPAEAATYVDTYIRSRRELNHVAPFDPSLAGAMTIRPVAGGDTMTFGPRGAYRVRVVTCVHKVPCVGYCFSEQKTRLRPEFAAFKAEMAAKGQLQEFGKEMAAKRRRGEEVTEEYFEPLFAFLGDTHPAVFDANPWLFEYPVIITECTYLDEAERERAERVGHTVWSRLRPVIVDHPETTFVLIHFSLRHSDREVVEFFAQELAAADGAMLQNIVVWAHREGLLPEQHQSSGAPS